MRSMFAMFSVLALTTLSGPALADRAMKCTFSSEKSAGFALGDVVFSLKSGESEATLRSTITDYFKMGEVKARVVTDSPKVLVLSWSVNAKNNANEYTKMKYTLKIMGDGSKAYYRAQPLAYDNEFNSQGRCKPMKG